MKLAIGQLRLMMMMIQVVAEYVDKKECESRDWTRAIQIVSLESQNHTTNSEILVEPSTCDERSGCATFSAKTPPQIMSKATVQRSMPPI